MTMTSPIPASDGTDYLYTKHDRDWRVRVRVLTSIATVAPINGEQTVEAAGVGLAISVALLDADGNVATTPTGELRIFPSHTLTIQHDSLQRIDPAAAIETSIQNQIDAAEKQLLGRDALTAALAPFRAS